MRSDFNWFLIQEVLVCICSVKEFWSIVGQYMAAPYVSVVGTCLQFIILVSKLPGKYTNAHINLETFSKTLFIHASSAFASST